MMDSVILIDKPIFRDSRGLFSKPFGDGLQSEYGSKLELAEVFYSISGMNVLRGMHYQKRPYDHTKLVSVIKGSVLDVVVDINPESASYGEFKVYEIDENSKFSILIPPGCAHGFLSTSSDSILLYHTTTSHEPAADTGIRWDSFGFEWPIDFPKMSDRDKNLPALGNNEW